MEEAHAMNHEDGRDEAEAKPFLPITATDIGMSDRGEGEGEGQFSPPSPTSSKFAVYLEREVVSLFMIVIYSVAAIFSWTIIAILSKHAINGQPYSVDIFAKRYTDTAAFQRSERWYRAAKVVNSGVVSLTIPLASAICARAAVMYTQHRRSGLTIRQVGVLADQGWTSVGLLVALLRPRNWKKYSTLLLWLAILLHVLGFLISPAQQLFLSSSTIKTPVGYQAVEISDIMALSSSELNSTDEDGEISAQLRSLLGSTLLTDVPSTLWFNNNTKCTLANFSSDLPSCFDEDGGSTWEDIADASLMPFTAQVSSTYSTGLVRQFAPRLNSSVIYTQVDESEFPENCDQITGAFYAAYSAVDSQFPASFEYTAQACMPADLRKTPWNATRSRQDISETLYLNISQSSYNTYSSSGVFRVQANTTAGYFELPSYLNNNTPGPLLDNGPDEACDRHCLTQGYSSNPISNPNADAQLYLRDDINVTQKIESSDFRQLEYLLSKPPLMAVTIALFGAGSFISARTRTANLGEYDYAWTNTTEKNDAVIETICQDPLPLGGIFNSLDREFYLVNIPCIENVGIEETIAEWLQLFTGLSLENGTSFSDIQNALLISLFLSNELWLSRVLSTSFLDVVVNQDMGSDLNVPVLSNAGIIAITVLLASFILSLFAMWAYATYVPVWTTTLNSFAMMRIGAEMGTEVPFLLGYHEDEIDVLDSTPGWVGDATPDAETGQLQLGAAAQLQSGRKYASYGG